MIKSGHPLRDAVLLSLPVVALLGYITITGLISFYNIELKNFHGYPVRSLRHSGLQGLMKKALTPLLTPFERRFAPDNLQPITKQLKVFDLWIEGSSTDALELSMPHSSKKWQPAVLNEQNGPVPVKARYRGQRFDNYFFRRKSWKLKTPKRKMIDGYRIINLVPAENRLENYLSFFVARQLGLPTPKARFVKLFVNHKDQGLYIQEEQVDESMMRHAGYMPGDIFYGDLFFPEEPKMSSKDLFWNPFLWEKHDRYNRYSKEFRPHLSSLLDWVSDDNPSSYKALQSLLDSSTFPVYSALLILLGDQHVDHSHNHKLYFDPISGKFIPIIWNTLMDMPKGHGIESTANRFYKKLAKDPIFLDQVHTILWTKILAANFSKLMLDELDRISLEYLNVSLPQQHMLEAITSLKKIILTRQKTISRHYAHAEISYLQEINKSNTLLRLFPTAVASLLLDEIVFDSPANNIKVYEDRNSDGIIGSEDRLVQVQPNGNTLKIVGNAINLYVGRDFSASYNPVKLDGVAESYSQKHDYTRLATLESRLLLEKEGHATIPTIIDLKLRRSVGTGLIEIKKGHPKGLISTETNHPWRRVEQPAIKKHKFSGTVVLLENLVVEVQDILEIEPGTIFRMGPNISLIIKSQVNLNNVRFERFNPKFAWGVLALQGSQASGSQLENMNVSGGSDATNGFIYYSGMLSVYDADDVTVRNSQFSQNIRGDDTIRFAHAKNLLLDTITVLNSSGDAIDCDISSGTINNITIKSPINDGIDLMTSKIELKGIEINGAGDKGFSLGESSEVKVEQLIITNSATGIAIKDASKIILKNATISNNRVAISSYDKNWRYAGGGHGQFTDCNLLDNEIDVSLDKHSTLVLERCKTNGHFQVKGKNPNKRLQVFNALAKEHVW